MRRGPRARDGRGADCSGTGDGKPAGVAARDTRLRVEGSVGRSGRLHEKAVVLPRRRARGDRMREPPRRAAGERLTLQRYGELPAVTAEIVLEETLDMAHSGPVRATLVLDDAGDEQMV